MNIYNFSDYRAVLEGLAAENPLRGGRGRMAVAAQSSPSWITRVLNGSVHLTPDQAAGLADYFHLDDAETNYFLLLVDLERASSGILKKRIQKKLEILKLEGRKLTSAIRETATVPKEAAARYYSSWIYSAVHVQCMIKSWTSSEIAAKLLLAEELVIRTLKELREVDLVKIEGLLWSATSKSVHLPSNHPIANLTHAIWRNRTVQHLQEGGEEGLHYSAVHCLSKSDMENIHRLLKDTVVKCRKTIQDSPSEVLGVFCLDWYEL